MLLAAPRSETPPARRPFTRPRIGKKRFGAQPTPFRGTAPRHRGAPLSDLEACYFAALILGLQLIDEQHLNRAERNGLSADAFREQIRVREAASRGSSSCYSGNRFGNALQRFVQDKGKQIAVACGLEPHPALPRALT